MIERSHNEVPPWAALEPPVAAALRPALPALADEIIATVRVAVPAYAIPLRGSFARNIRLGVEQALGGFLELIESRGEARLPGREVYEGLGRGEVRAGRSLEALLSAYRAGAQLSWRRLAEQGQRAGLPPATLYTLAEAIFAYIDELSAATAYGHVQAQSAAAGERLERRRRLLGLLLRDPPPAVEEIEVAARDAGWAVPACLAVVAVAPGRPEALPARVAEGVLVSGEEEGTVLLAVPDPDGPGVRAQLTRALRDAPAALGPAVTPADARHSAQRARAALALHARLAAGEVAHALVVADDHLPDLLLAAQPRLAADLVGRRLAPLDDLPETVRERLTETLAAWLEHLGEARPAAETLNVHVQTVRYRLGQLRELLGDALDDPDARLELALALRVRGAVPSARRAVP
jgi:hypothetical protein